VSLAVRAIGKIQLVWQADCGLACCKHDCHMDLACADLLQAIRLASPLPETNHVSHMVCACAHKTRQLLYNLNCLTDTCGSADARQHQHHPSRPTSQNTSIHQNASSAALYTTPALVQGVHPQLFWSKSIKQLNTSPSRAVRCKHPHAASCQHATCMTI
jgi:hypothetical protein